MFRIGKLSLGMALALAMAGCATGTAEVPDEEAIAAIADQWSAAMIAHDVDALMALHSENFSDADGNTKASFREFIEDQIKQGTLTNLMIARDIAVLTITGDTATYDGIGLSSDLGGLTVYLTFAREAEGWKIISLRAE